MRLRTSLLIVMAGVGLPLLLLALGLGYLLVERERQAFLGGAEDRTQALVSAVETELRSHARTLNGLGSSSSLEKGDLRAFREEAIRTLKSQPDWLNISLFDSAGQSLLNTAAPPGTVLHEARQLDTVHRAVETRAPVVGRLSPGRVTGVQGLPIRVPVVHDGRVSYVLSARIRPATFETLVEHVALPAGWCINILDSDLQVVAAVPPREAGSRVSSAVQSAVRTAERGWIRGVSTRGIDSFIVHGTAAASGWSVSLAIPAAHVYAQGRRAFGYIAAALLTSLLLVGISLAWARRHLSRPIAELAAAAGRLGVPGHRRAATEPAIHELRQVARAFEQAGDAIAREQAALREADRGKNEFLAMLGHELRNPLAAIQTAAYILRVAQAPDPQALRAREIIDRQTQQMKRLVDDLLDVSRLAIGKLALKLERLDLSLIAGETIDGWMQGAGCRPGRVLAELTPVLVEGDRARLGQVIANLLDNAAKFSADGTSIQVRVGPQQDRAVIQVSDQGEGMTPEVLIHVFDVFVQGPQNPDRARGGMGLGLALVKRLVELQHGTVSAVSPGPGKGSTFTVTLPAVTAPAVLPSLPQPPRAYESQGQYRVLVVDDNADAADMMKSLLVHEGHTVLTAYTGSAALVAARAWSPDIVLLDIGLPDIDGYEVARRMCAEPRRPRIVAVTGYGEPEDQRKSREAGCEIHLVKPVTVDELREAFAQLCTNGRLLRVSAYASHTP